MKNSVNPLRWMRLRYRADIRTLLFLAVLNLLLVIQWRHVANGWYLLLPTYVLSVVALVAKHNHIHCATFVDDHVNSAFEIWLTLLTGATTTGIITAHNRLHHGNNNSDADFVRCSLVNHRHNWMNLLAFFFVSVRGVYRNRPADLQEWKRNRPALYRQALAERILLCAMLVALLVADAKATLAYCGGPWLFAEWVLVTINLLQHQDCDFDSEFAHSRNITGKFTNWVLLNNGLHTVHHNSPALHWSLLPEAHGKMAPRIQCGLNQRSLWACVWRRFVTGEDWRGKLGSL